MAKKRVKKRTHSGPSNPNANKNSAPLNTGNASIQRDPKSMVIRIGAGEVGSSVSQLAADVRRVMEPGTASRLRERRANRLRDYTTMCGPLGVTHLLLFSRSASGNTNLRIALTPRGPTFHFRVEKYSLSKDVRKAQRRPKGGGKEYLTAPLLVMNNFSSPSSDTNSNVPKHLESLATTVFQSLFPPINPQVTPLQSIRRILLLDREEPATQGGEDDGSFVLSFRHYAITTKTTGISRPLKRLNAAEKLISGTGKGTRRKGGLPNLGKLQDIADYMIGGEDGAGCITDGGTSGSEAETDAEVEVLQTATRKVSSAKARSAAAAAQGEGGAAAQVQDIAEHDNVERKSVKLVELGPRLRLRMTKVEEGLCSGKIMWHEYIHKSRAELKEMERKWDQRHQEKEARRKQQRDNVEKKLKAKAAQKGGAGAEGDEDEDEDMDIDDLDSDAYEVMNEDDEGIDSEGLEGDAEALVNQRMEEDGQWEDEEDEIAGD